MISLPVLQLVATLTGTGYAQHALQEAVKLFESPDEERAKAAFLALVANAPPPEIEAKAHVYLGLLALAAADADGAKLEFEKGLRLDPSVELPTGQPPRARALFAGTREGVAPHPPPDSAPPASATGSAPAEPQMPAHLPAWIVGGVGVAALVTGGILGVLQQQSLNSVESDATWVAAKGDAQAYQSNGIAADVLFGIGTAAVVTAVVLYFTVGTAKTPAVAVSAGPQGLVLAGAF